MNEKELFLQITVLPHFGLTLRLLAFSLSVALVFVVPAWKVAVGVPQNIRVNLVKTNERKSPPKLEFFF